MPTSFSFTSSQLIKISELREVLGDAEHKSAPSGAVPLYSYIFKCITGIDLGDPSYVNNAAAVVNTIKQRFAQDV